MCLSHLIYTVRPCLINTCHAMPMPCSDHAVFLKATAQHGRLSTVGAWHGHGIASVNQTRPHCVNRMGKTHSKPLAARHGRGTAWARHTMCESAIMQITRGSSTRVARQIQNATATWPIVCLSGWQRKKDVRTLSVHDDPKQCAEHIK